MSEILRRQGHEALTASDFDSADAILRDANVDVAVIDVILPGKNGVDLLKALRRRDQDIPVLMMTGQPEVSLIPDILRAGPCDFMAKPVLKEDLIGGVARALQTRQLMQEKQRLEAAAKSHAVQLEGLVEERTGELADARRQSDEALKLIRKRLATTERIAALGRVAAQVAHEVKNPLAGLKLYALHLKSKIELGLAPSETTLVDKIVDTIDHLSETVERVLDFAHPIGQARHPVDLNRLVDDAIHMLESQIRANNIVLKTDLCQTGSVGMLDEPSIRSALVNLILNAIQSMPGGGDLGISTFRQDRWIQLIVSDTGCGIDEERLETVFEPFNSTKSRGLGLGLPYSKKVIDEHGGRISVESQKNRGTRVEVMLPAEK